MQGHQEVYVHPKKSREAVRNRFESFKDEKWIRMHIEFSVLKETNPVCKVIKKYTYCLYREAECSRCESLRDMKRVRKYIWYPVLKKTDPICKVIKKYIYLLQKGQTQPQSIRINETDTRNTSECTFSLQFWRTNPICKVIKKYIYLLQEGHHSRSWFESWKQTHDMNQNAHPVFRFEGDRSKFQGHQEIYLQPIKEPDFCHRRKESLKQDKKWSRMQI